MYAGLLIMELLCSLCCRKLLFLAIFVACIPKDNTAEELNVLILTQILYRHGDRSPVTTFPTDKYQEDDWPQGFGQLSQTGMAQHYELGRFLRERYIDGSPYSFLNSSYSRYEVEINSTDYDRTLMSAYSNLAGLYSPTGHQVWNSNITWQPIPVHTKPLEDDHVLNVLGRDCPEFYKYYQKSLHSDAIKQEEKVNAEFYQYVANNSGIEHVGVESVWKVYDTLFCESSHNFTLPTWATVQWNGTETVMKKMRNLESLQFDVKFDHPIQNRLSGGPLLKEMTWKMKEKVHGSLQPRQRKAFIYSAHDTTVAAFMSALKVFNRMLPPYASCVMVELYNNSLGQYSVGVFFRNSSDHPHTLTIPNCTHPCPFEKYLKLTKANIPDDWHAECQAESSSINTRLVIIAALLSVGLAAVAVCVAVCIYKWRMKRDVSYLSIQTEP